MDQLIAKIKVPVTSPQFQWLKAMTINANGITILPQHREDELNELLISCIFILMMDYKVSVTAMTPEIFTQCLSIIPILVKYYCIYYLQSKGVTLTPDKSTALDSKIMGCNLTQYITQVFTVRVNGNRDPFGLTTSIRSIAFDDKSCEPDFIKQLTAEYMTNTMSTEQVHTQLYNDIEELKPGMNVCNMELIECLHKSEKSQVWKAKKGTYFVALKMSHIEIPDKMLKSKSTDSVDKIVEYIMSKDEEFLGWKKLAAFSGKSSSFKIDYYYPLSMCVKIMDLFESDMKTKPPSDKRTFLPMMGMLLMELHCSGMIYNNMCMEHIVRGKSKATGKQAYFLIDYRNINTVKSQYLRENLPKHGYNSLSVCSGSPIYTHYDDIESLFFLYNDIITKSVTEYTNPEDEVMKKTHLNVYSGIITKAITELRQIRAADIYANSYEAPPNMEEYMKSVYTGTSSKRGIGHIINEVITAVNEIPEIAVSLNPSQLALLQHIRNLLANDQRYVQLGQKINELSIMIVNFMTLGTTYDDQYQQLINAFVTGR